MRRCLRVVDDKAMVDAIRQLLGMKLLYAKNTEFTYKEELLLEASLRRADLEHRPKRSELQEY